MALRWRSSDTGFVIETLPPGLATPKSHAWLHPQTRASVSTLWLGPEPILPPQSLVLTQGDGSRGRVRVGVRVRVRTRVSIGDIPRNTPQTL